MSTNPTTNRAYGKPTVNGSSAVWGTELNALFDAVDTDVHKLLNTAGYAAGGGTVDVITLTLDPAPSAYATGMWVRFKTSGANTAGVTLNVNGLGAKNLYQQDGSTLTAGALQSGGVYVATYDGTQFRLVDAPRASAADTLTGTDAFKVLTPAGLAGNKSLAADGYYKFPGGFVIQWGDTASISADSTGNNISFPVAFSTACVHVSVTPTMSDSAVSGGSYYGNAVTARSTTGFTFTNDSPAGVHTWVAFGY